MDSRRVRWRQDPRRALEWGVAASTLEGQIVSGDLPVVHEHEDGVVLAVIDGLGHGPEAARAARRAASTLEQFDSASPEVLLQACHRVMIGQRGGVMSIASINWLEEVMTWTGIGDVAGVRTVSDGVGIVGFNLLVTHGGILGAGPEPGYRAQRAPFRPGDTVILATDGVDAAFTAVAAAPHPPQQLAESILRRYARGTDDALVLVGRYVPMTREDRP